MEEALTQEVEWRIYASVKLTIIASENGMSPDRRQAIIWTNAAILSIDPKEHISVNTMLHRNVYVFNTLQFAWRKTRSLD